MTSRTTRSGRHARPTRASGDSNTHGRAGRPKPSDDPPAQGVSDLRPFLARYPYLFHVTRRSAIDGIARRGLRSASSLTAGLGRNVQRDENRTEWTDHVDREGSKIWLRWQRLRDPVLHRRLPESISPMAWRRFINGMVFLFPSLKDAEGLRRSPVDAAVDQVILRFRSAALIDAGCALRLCRWNNGFPDRTRPPRQRSYDDYRLAQEWRRGDTVREVTIAGEMPAKHTFRGDTRRLGVAIAQAPYKRGPGTSGPGWSRAAPWPYCTRSTASTASP
jgi:hypothetical protein